MVTASGAPRRVDVVHAAADTHGSSLANLVGEGGAERGDGRGRVDPEAVQVQQPVQLRKSGLPVASKDAEGGRAQLAPVEQGGAGRQRREGQLAGPGRSPSGNALEVGPQTVDVLGHLGRELVALEHPADDEPVVLGEPLTEVVEHPPGSHDVVVGSERRQLSVGAEREQVPHVETATHDVLPETSTERGRRAPDPAELRGGRGGHGMPLDGPAASPRCSRATSSSRRTRCGSCRSPRRSWPAAVPFVPSRRPRAAAHPPLVPHRLRFESISNRSEGARASGARRWGGAGGRGRSGAGRHHEGGAP